jgi:3-oxo-5-alpha-steroid 4-dehydrogenase 1
MTIATFNIVVLIWIGFAILLFPVILKIPAPYGRHSQTNWGPMINNKLGWFIMEAPALFIFSYFIITSENIKQNVIIVFAFLWIVHYFNRVIIFPLRIRTSGKKMPIVIMIFALFFNFINGLINGYWFGTLTSAHDNNWFADPRFIFGSLLFVAGFVVNQYHDKILISLRKASKNGYQIPFGGLFKYVSCPNFLGEIIEWAGFALMTWCLPTLSFFIWTMVNLIPRALDHHRWYNKTFPDYPKGRKAIFPSFL